MANLCEMTAKIGPEQQEATNHSGAKELVASWQAVTTAPDGSLVNPVTVRCWMGRSNSASVVYASVWVSGVDFWTSGRGNAGGFGYCKQSAAVDDAIRSAGIELDQSIHGVGESGIRYAINAIVAALGYSGEVLIIQN